VNEGFCCSCCSEVLKVIPPIRDLSGDRFNFALKVDALELAAC